MRLREWSGTRLVAALAAGWVAAYILFFVAINTKNLVSESLVALAWVFTVMPSVIATVWSWNRTELRSWHFGKFLILWGLLGFLLFVFRNIERGLEIIVVLLGGIPLLVLTWSWLTAREKQ